MDKITKLRQAFAELGMATDLDNFVAFGRDGKKHRVTELTVFYSDSDGEPITIMFHPDTHRVVTSCEECPDVE